MKVFPDFPSWKSFVKQNGGAFSTSEILDIDPQKVGVIQTNTKYSYPCDNSLIRAEKYMIGGRRIGVSLVLKDNLVFGVRERS